MALTLSALLGMAGLATDVGLVLYKQRQMQTAADAAAFSAAIALPTGLSAARAEAKAVAGEDGFVDGANGVTVTVNNPPASPDANASNANAVQVIIQQAQSPLLSTVVTSGKFNVSAQAVADSVPPTVSSCVLALSASGTGVSLSGGTKISAPTCAVASQASIVVHCGDTITAKNIYYNGATPTQPCSGISGPIKKASTADPLASNAGVVAANARAIADESMVRPTIPTIPSTPSGVNLSFGYSGNPMSGTGCTGTLSSGTWTVTCPAGGTYNFGSLSMSGGITVNFNVNNVATYNFSGLVTDSGAALKFGSGTFNMAKGLTTGGGSTTTFGAGTFYFGGPVTNGGNSLTFGGGTFNMAAGLHTLGGSTTTFGAGTFYIGQQPSTAPCTDGYYYSVCNLESGAGLSISGPSTFVLTSGIYNGGGDDITLGAGSTNNSYAIGASSKGYALNLGGGSITTFADATGANSVFQVVGNLTESGGACTTFPAASNHDINGNVSLMGGLQLGSGLYAVTGSFLVGASGGGDVWCASASANVGVSGSNVTIAVAGSGAANGANVFVIGAGFNHLTVSAPTTGAYKNVTIVGPLSTSATGGILLDEGASATTLGGSIYFPNGPMTLSGGASVANGANQCLEIVAADITLSGGTSMTAAPCFASSSGSQAAALVE